MDKSLGVTPTERYLGRLAQSTFLGLWSWPNVFRAPGKELVDLLVLFDPHVILFSDKHKTFPSDGKLDVSWCRWYRHTVEHGADQLFGAERVLRREHPDLWIDASCKQRLPLNLPPPTHRLIHRVVVAHGIRNLPKILLGGSPTLGVCGGGGTPKPYYTYQTNVQRGFVHIFDTESLRIVLTTLDTVSDFTAYLERRERFLRNERLDFAAGEEELLAHYLSHIGPDGGHDFVLPANGSSVVLKSGGWTRFSNSPQRQNQLRDDAQSYLWDHIIEDFNNNALRGTLHTSPGSIAAYNDAIKYLAEEPRLARRSLAKSLAEVVISSSNTRQSARLVLHPFRSERAYIFVTIPYDGRISHDDYRRFRQNYLRAYCQAAKYHHPSLQIIIGIGTESGRDMLGRSHDIVRLDATRWSPADQNKAQKVVEELGLLKSTAFSSERVSEYPLT